MQQAILNMLVFLPEMEENQRTQAELMEMAKKYPISGIEIRREMLPQDKAVKAAELDKIREIKAAQDWTLYYSVPESLFVGAGLNPEIRNYFEEGRKMNVDRIKMNIGDIEQMNTAQKELLEELLAEYKITLTIENDQTPANGPFAHVKTALANVRTFCLPVNYTFDTGNWCWHGDDPITAAEELGSKVHDLHIKNVTDLMTTAIAAGSIDWKKVMQTINGVPVVMEYPTPTADIVAELKLINQEIERVNR